MAGVQLRGPADVTSPPPFRYPVTHTARLNGASVVPPVKTKASGYVTITLKSPTRATGALAVANIHQMTAASLYVGAVGRNGPAIALAFNAAGVVNGSFKTFFSFDPSVSNAASLLANAVAYLNVQTVSNSLGEIRGQV